MLLFLAHVISELEVLSVVPVHKCQILVYKRQTLNGQNTLIKVIVNYFKRLDILLVGRSLYSVFMLLEVGFTVVFTSLECLC